MRSLTRLFNTVALIYYRTPAGLRWVYWLVPVIYFLFPFDFLPDVIPFLGRIDDILLVVLGFWALDRARNYFGMFKEAKTNRGRQQHDTSGTAHQQTGSDQSPHEVLGIKVNATRAEIKKAYRQLINQYHPDKFAHLGAEFEKVAQDRTRRIVEAYEKLSR
jgi:uncharacterized membrane protein YkvA (DUF1232 family)